MPNIEITQQYVIYQGQSKLLELASEIAQSRSVIKPEIKAKIQKATKLRLWLKALNYAEYLDRGTREKIWYALMDIGNLNDLPYAPVLTTNEPPTIITGIPGRTGNTGQTGATGGGTAFTASAVAVDTVVDSFDITLSGSAQWQYEVTDSTNKRVEILTGTWLSDGSEFVDDGGITLDPAIGDSSGITFQVNIDGTTVQLLALVTSGTWEVKGTRLLIPVTGNGITQPSSLASGKLWVGNNSNQPEAQTISGDFTISNTGVGAISPGVIVNADINSSAAIAVNKLAALTASKAVITDSNGFLTTSTTAASKVAFLANVTSDIQAQIDAIAVPGTISGAITPYVTSNAIPSRVVVSNPAGKLTTSLTTSSEIGYLNGVTSAIQTQLDGKQATITGAASTATIDNFTAYRYVVVDGSGKFAVSTTEATDVDGDSGEVSPGIGDDESVGDDIDFSKPLQDMALTLKTITTSGPGTQSFTAGTKGSRVYVLQLAGGLNQATASISDGSGSFTLAASSGDTGFKNFINLTDMPGIPVEKVTEQPFYPVGAGTTFTLTLSFSGAQALVTYVDLE